MLEDVLQLKPKTWEEASYGMERYHTFELQEGDAEYLGVVRDFKCLVGRITQVKRVQNPYLYGRFILRKEQYQVTSKAIAEIRKFHAISQKDIVTICEHNMDPRRYAVQIGGDLKHPRFYETPDAALGSLRHLGNIPCAVVVVKVLGIGEGSINVAWDTEYYPEYLVLLING